MKDDKILSAIINLLKNQKREYLIKCGDSEDLYLNKFTGGEFKSRSVYMLGGGSYQSMAFRTHFTIKEIIEIIKKDVIYLDWSKVKFEEVKEDE